MTTSSEERLERLRTEPFRLAGPRPGFASGTLASLRDILAQRELMGLLVRRELKARYKDSTLGFVWSLLRPLALLLIYFVAIGQFLGAARAIPDFAVFIYTGLTAWQLFSETVTAGTGSIVANSGLVKKVYLPREVFPISVAGSAMFNFAIQGVILVAATFAVGKPPTGARWLYLPLSLAVLLVFAMALALLLSAVNVYLRDVQYLVEIALMIGFWMSPIVYSWGLVLSQKIPAWAETLYVLNPMTLVIMGFQRTFWVAGDGQPVPADLAERLGVCLAVGLVLLWLCQRVFARLQSNFAQEL